MCESGLLSEHGPLRIGDEATVLNAIKEHILAQSLAAVQTARET